MKHRGMIGRGALIVMAILAAIAAGCAQRADAEGRGEAAVVAAVVPAEIVVRLGNYFTVS